MSQPSFDGLGPFKDDMPWLDRANAVRDLMAACFGIAGTATAMGLLGDPQNRERRAQALAILNGLGALPIRRILSRLLVIEAKRRRQSQEVA